MLLKPRIALYAMVIKINDPKLLNGYVYFMYDYFVLKCIIYCLC